MKKSKTLNFSIKKVLGEKIHTSLIQTDSWTKELMNYTLIKTVHSQLDEEAVLVGTLQCKNSRKSSNFKPAGVHRFNSRKDIWLYSYLNIKFNQSFNS